MLLIEDALFALDVLEHVFVLWKHNVVRENVRVAFVKLVNSREPLLALVVLPQGCRTLGLVDTKPDR